MGLGGKMSSSCRKCQCHKCTKNCSLRCVWCKDDGPLENCYDYEGPKEEEDK